MLLKERDNKKEAQRILDDKLNNFQPDLFEIQPEPIVKNDIIFMDYVEDYANNKQKDFKM